MEFFVQTGFSPLTICPVKCKSAGNTGLCFAELMKFYLQISNYHEAWI